MPRWWKSGNTYMYSKTGEGGCQGRGMAGGAREGRRESPPHPRRTGNLLPQPDPCPSQKWPGHHIFLFQTTPPKTPLRTHLPRRSGRRVQPPGGSYGRGERTSVGASLGAGRGSRRVGAQRSGRRSGVGAPAPTEPAGPPPLPRGGKPTERWTDCRGNGGDGRDGLKGRDRARTGRETARSGSGSSPCRGGLGAEASGGEVAEAGEMREEGAPGGVQPASHG